MSEITEKRTFKVPPCKIDKSLIKELGQILEAESPTIYNVHVEIEIKRRSKQDYYKKYPKELKKDAEESVLPWEYKPSYTLVADSKNIKSAEFANFTDVEWPSDTKEINLSIGHFSSPRKIEINLYLERWRMKQSEVSVSGKDSTWVNGIADRLEAVFQKKLLGYRSIVEHSLLRMLLSILTWISIAFAITYLSWPMMRPFLKEGVTWIELFVIILFFGGFVAVWVLEEFLSWLFPRFEFGEVSLPRRVRKWIWGLLVGSGFIANIIFKLVGLE